MTLPTMLPHGRDEVLRWCRGIDEGPWSGLAVPERVTYSSHSMTVQLAAAAALTERVRLWTTIVVLPSHNAVRMAKDLASVDRLSNGRLTVGVGVGGREQDYRAVSAPFDHRWQRLDDQIATMRATWAGTPPEPDLDPVGPPPVQHGGPPLVSGAIGPKATARA
ncbi:MAG: LLM class flavin-dependent oxidoreductase, partial [Streptomycetaceae bacterium]|nr:LLM class flavin-dependent oxidoreductase [Streptomycetaceae bacterium]